MIEVTGGPCFTVGAPRPGRMHLGVPPGGALVPELLAAANRAAGRPDGAEAVEHWGPVTVRGHGVVGAPDGPLRVDGALVVRPSFRVGYLALATLAPPRPGLAFDARGPIRVVMGPDLPGTVLGGGHRVAALGNRVGIRLSGPAVAAPSGRGPSAPMVRGAVQLPPSGELIVLGPDHPTTGGYPVIAVVCAADIGRLCARGPGEAVDFEPISIEEARRLPR